LQPQHLACVDAAAAISRATVDGAARNSIELTFWPGKIRTGRFHFEIKTAGSACLVLQTIYLPLSLADSASTVSITGGTHVPWAPSYHYLERHWLPLLSWLGFPAELKLLQAGFYPRGGGRIQATIRPCTRTRPLQVDRLSEPKLIRGISFVSNLDKSIAERQKRQAVLKLLPSFPNIQIKVDEIPAASSGTHLMLKVTTNSSDSAPVGGCYTALGERGKPAERVADEAVNYIIAYDQSGACVDRFLADQILLPLALVNAASQFTTDAITSHLLTNTEIIRAFLPIDIEIEGQANSPGRVTLQPKIS
jgi:RNA 3'-terminal phosphate cyclase (ATP)